VIDFYTWKTPNGHKIAIMLEETQLPYRLHTVDISQQEQFHPDFLKINPNNKIPVIVDHDGPQHQPINVFESGAILLYLAEKTGQFIPTHPRLRVEMLKWLMFQMSGVGPMLGQLHHFLHYAPVQVSYGIERYTAEAQRLYRVMNERLEKTVFFAGDYSIADMAIFPWVNLHERQNINLSDYPAVQRWHAAIVQRPAVSKGLALV
jgi:GST-like protein